MKKTIILGFQDHKTRSIFRRLRISNWEIARFLGFSHSRTWAILTGRSIPTQEIDQQLQELAAGLESGTVKTICQNDLTNDPAS